MSQPPNYVVRQDSGGKLKLLLIRDPRATHVAKISPVKKQPGAAVSLSQTNSTTSSQQQRATTSSTSHVTITAVPTKLRLPDRPSVAGTASSASSSSFGASLSPTLLTHAANQAMGQAALVPSSGRARSTSTKVDGGGGGGGRVKGGKIVKLNNSKSPKKSPPTAKLHTSVLHSSHSTSPHAPSGSSESPGLFQRMLPVSRVRTIMRTDVHTASTTNSISQDSVVLVAKATELFIAQLARDAHMVAVSAAERDVHYCHLSTAVRKEKKTEFLHDILPGKVVVRDHLESLGNQTDHTHSNNCSADSSQ